MGGDSSSIGGDSRSSSLSPSSTALRYGRPMHRKGSGGRLVRHGPKYVMDEHVDVSQVHTIEEAEPTGDIALPPARAFYPALIPVPYPFWHGTAPHEVVKPIPVLGKESRNVEEVVGMSKLRIGPSELSVKMMLEDSTTRQSAFHVKQPNLSPNNSSQIHAV